MSNAQQVAPPSQDKNLSQQANTLLSKARVSEKNSLQLRIEWANKALQLSENFEDLTINAQAHFLLGKLTSQALDNDATQQHFLKASKIYQQLNDTENYVLSYAGFINALIESKQFTQADTAIKKLVPAAFQHGEALPIGIILNARGDSYYEQNKYDLAIVQYLMAVEYLTGDDASTQRLNGRILVKIAQAYKRLKAREKTAEYYQKALAVFTDLNDTRSMARTLNTLAEAERYLGHLVLALDFALRSLSLHNQIDDADGQAKALMGAGIIYRHIGRYEQSLKLILQAHKYYKQINDATGIAKTSNQIGHIYFRLEQFDQAHSFFMLTISLAENNVAPKTLATALRESAIIDWSKGNYTSALELAQKADTIYRESGDREMQSVTQRILANVYRDQNNLSKAHFHYQASLSLATEISSEFYQVKTLIPFAAMLIETNIEEAIDRLKTSLTLSLKNGYKDYTLESYRYLRLAEKSRGNIAASLEYAEKEIALTELIQEDINNNELALEKAKLHSLRLEIELETLREKTKLDKLELARKNNEIEIAQQSNEIAELQLIKNRYASVALALALAVCLILVVLTYRRFVVSTKENQELDYLATRDPLTNCFNRRVLFDSMERDFAKSPLPVEYCVLMIDIDHFKAINDNYGHTIGDSVLCNVANTLQNCVRQDDVVARFGGEEFCILLPNTISQQALHIAETMRKAVQDSRFESIEVTCSVGVTSIRFKAQTPSELIVQADLALFESKSLGRNKVTLWNESLAEAQDPVRKS
ncbi:diguanylate cyclase [Alteromonas sp. 1_MG-2023]|uniref:tetratricopeptide repeat-containing diguanylate cyclase n=1 Tax=Alteromonas sp. 1_MG-2023 TaxID=3062669 RepID=UPI0026E1F009|nr:tetratricopeptide repeat-containing diguanylate cyclase [Alteromonas sp. 1_MG-2023]MDO6566429.1 diguanylate cyclase [Alteromonas sp. 1_MG-2023]